MSGFFEGRYAGFILSAYGITFVVLLVMILWVVLTARSRRQELAQLEAAGLRRAASKTDG